MPTTSHRRRLRLLHQQLSANENAGHRSTRLLEAAAPGPQTPNILLILTDQQSHELMGCAGSPQSSWVSTPNCDRLASQGALFTRAYCSNPVCMPSRFSMFSGRMPSAIGMRENGVGGLTSFTDEDDRTGLGHVLAQAGYRCFYGGKVHWPVGLTPERLGFQVYCTDERERLAVDTASLLHAQGSGGSGDGPFFICSSLINPHDICYQALRAHAETQPEALDPAVASVFGAGTGTAQIQELQNLDEALLPPLESTARPSCATTSHRCRQTTHHSVRSLSSWLRT